MYRRIGALLWYGLVGVVISLAVALSLARAMLPNMSGYKSELEQLVSQRVRHDVSIGALDAAWHGISPVLALKSVSVTGADMGHTALEVGEVRIALDVWKSLLSRQWQIGSVDLVGVDLTVYRSTDGRWSLNESPAETGDPARFEPLWALGRVGLKEAKVSVIDQSRGGLTRIFRELELRLVNEGRRHRFSLQARLPGTLGRRLHIVADMQGQGGALSQWAGRIYCRADQLQLRQWLNWFSVSQIGLEGNVGGELWLSWSDRRITGLSGEIEAKALSYSETGDDRRPYRLERFAGRFAWWGSQTGWRLHADELAMRRGPAADWSGIVLSADWAGETGQFRLAANTLPLAELSLLSPKIPLLKDSLRHWIGRLEPQGVLQDLELETIWPVRSETPSLSLRSRFSGLGIQASDTIPGLSGLSGSLEGNQQSGAIRFAASDAVLLAPKLFSTPLVMSALDAEIHWQRYADRYRFTSRNLQLRIADALAVEARWQLDWLGAENAPILDAQIALDDFDLHAVPAYLPARVLPPRAVAWMERAFKQGRIRHGRVMFQGQLDQAPFDHGEGVLAAGFDIEAAVLDYSRQWGRLDGLQGRGDFLGRSLRIEADHATIMRSPVHQVVASIDDLAKPVLQVSGEVGGRLPDMLAYLESSPLKQRFSRLLDHITPGGDAELALQLKIPLKKQLGKLGVEGRLAFRNCRLKEKLDAFSLTAINGNLYFTDTAISAKKIRARLFNAPVKVAVYQTAGDNPETVVSLNGALGLINRLKASGTAFATQLEGSTQWRARLFFPRRYGDATPAVRIRLESDLQGVASSLPVPFAKHADTAVPLTIQWVPGEPAAWPLRISYGEKVHAVFSRNRSGGVDRGRVAFDQGTPRLPDRQVLVLSGHLAEIKPLEWAKLFTGAHGKQSLPPLVFDLRTDTLSLFGYSVQDLHARSADTDSWNLSLTGAGARGALRLEFGDHRLRAVNADLDHLHVMLPKKNTARTGGADKPAPAEAPELHLKIADLRWGDLPLGRLRLDTGHSAQAMEIRRLSLASDALALDATGLWRDDGPFQSTRLDASIQGGSLERLLKMLGDRGTVDNGELSGHFQITWPGSPGEFSLKRMEGELQLQVGQGRLVDVETGAGKLLGLLSLQSIPRRLFLDFSDLFKKGYSFDKLEGSFIFNDGDAFTRDLKISGPAADIEIIGRTGLVDQDYDELITVIPHLTSALPIAGTIAGGPAVGAAVLLAERLIGDQVNKMTQVKYQVTGSWTNPVYSKLEKASKAETGKTAEPAFGDDIE